jgi:malonyl-CoA O-methyltransferase
VKRAPRPTNPAVRDGYDRWSEIYDHEANPLIGLEEPVVREALGDVAGLNVLDLGCGTGRHALWMAGSGASVTAVDFSEGMMEKARAKAGAENVRFLVHDLHQRLPFADAAFDRVVSGLVLEHLRDLGPFLLEARRVLKAGGRAVLSGMHPAMFLRDVRARFYDPATGEKVEPGSVPHTVGDLVMAAVRAGFALEGIDERAPDTAFAARYPRAEKYVGWPMLVVLRLGVRS